MGHQFRKERLHLLHADLTEKTARLEPLLDRLARGDQGVPVLIPDLNIDDQPILDGEIADDPVGIRKDGVMTGERCQDVRFDPHTAEGFVQQEPPQDRRDGEYP